MQAHAVVEPSTYSKIAALACCQVRKNVRSASSVFRVLKNDSAQALSKQSRLRLMLWRIPRRWRARQNASLVYSTPRSEWNRSAAAGAE